MKPVPFTVTVIALDPAAAVAGEIAEIAGVGLLIAKAAAADVPPPGAALTTVTNAVPVAAKSAAIMTAESCVALT